MDDTSHALGVTRRATLAALWCAALVLFYASTLRAEEPCDAQCLADRGVALYQIGDYEGAIEVFQQGYVLTQQAIFLFNISVCHHLLGQWDQALETSERLARSPGDLTSELQRDNQARGQALHVSIRARDLAAQLGQIAAAEERALSQARADELKARSSRPAPIARRVGWASLGAGVSAYGVSAWLVSRYAEPWRELEEAAERGDRERYDALRAEIAPQRRLAQGVFFGATAAGLLGAGLLWYARPRPLTSAVMRGAAARWTISALPSSRGVSLYGALRF